MYTVLLVVQVLLTVFLIGVILIQRSDNDGFGLGGGGGNQFMTGRATANFLTRTTAVLATLFIVNSLVLSIVSKHMHSGNQSLADQVLNAPASPAETGGADAAKQTGGGLPAALPEPVAGTAKTPAKPTGKVTPSLPKPE